MEHHCSFVQFVPSDAESIILSHNVKIVSGQFVRKGLTSFILSSVEDPYTIEVRESGTVIQFRNYQEYLPWRNVLNMLNMATSSAFKYDADTLIGQETLKYQEFGLLFMLIPTPTMTWRVWSSALWGMRMAAQDKGMFFEWSFGVGHSGRSVGFGFLSRVETRVVAIS